jgi:hypothetical protein
MMIVGTQGIIAVKCFACQPGSAHLVYWKSDLVDVRRSWV